MIDGQSLLLFMTATLALNLSPGPDMLYVIARSLAGGRRAGIASALGIGVGTFFHIALVALGVAAALAERPVVHNVLRIVGAVYLCYLGTRLLLRPSPALIKDVPPESDRAIFVQGIVTNILNPKVATFFLAFLPQFIDPARGNPGTQAILLGLLFDVSGTTVNIAVALAASSLAFQLRRGRTANRVQQACGVIMLLLGIHLMTT